MERAAAEKALAEKVVAEKAMADNKVAARAAALGLLRPLEALSLDADTLRTAKAAVVAYCDAQGAGCVADLVECASKLSRVTTSPDSGLITQAVIIVQSQPANRHCVWSQGQGRDGSLGAETLPPNAGTICSTVWWPRSLSSQSLRKDSRMP